MVIKPLINIRIFRHTHYQYRVILTIKMSSRAMLMYRLLRQHASGRLISTEMFLKVTQVARKEHFFATSCRDRVEDDDTKSDNSAPNVQPTFSRAMLSRRRRSLSPLERVSSLLPQESLTPEVQELREETRCSGINETMEVANDGETSDCASSEVTKGKTENQSNGALHHTNLKGETLLTFGEILVAKYRKDEKVEFKKMFKLLAGTLLQSSWGVIPHADIAGKPAGSIVRTNRGFSILIHRPSLADYVILMKRGPAIAYPKDASAMLSMMDVTGGDCVLEAGSGSGAMSLFLSRAVGASGSVLSLEVREDHLKRAVKNYCQWRASWELRRGHPWPDNVEFVQTDLRTATSVLQGRGFHAVALDLSDPQLVLPSVIPHLHSGAVCAIYLANITQVIDLLEGLRCLCLPLRCERIMELPLRDWLVVPALQKDGAYCTRKSPITQENFEQEHGALEKDPTEQGAAFGSIPYIARPHPTQLSHTAFLVQLRKYVQ